MTKGLGLGAHRIYPQLDGLRGLAALVILAYHYWPESSILHPAAGRIGVDFFFVLSGFLITRSLLRTRRESPDSPWLQLGRFYARRARRIIPLFYAILALDALWRWDRIRDSLLWHLSFLSNVYFIREGRYVGAAGHLWFVAVEQHFYLLWPLAILFLPRRWMRAAPLLLVAAGLLSRVIAGWMNCAPITIDIMTPGSFEALGIGACLTLVLEDYPNGLGRYSRGLLAVGLAGAALWRLTTAFHGGMLGRWVPLLGTELARSLVLVWLVAQAVIGLPGWIGRSLESIPARALGRWSFAIYLSHNFVKEEVGAYYGSWLVSAQPWIAVAVTLVFSAIAYRYIEKPLV